jgi:hypothetical protein
MSEHILNKAQATDWRNVLILFLIPQHLTLLTRDSRQDKDKLNKHFIKCLKNGDKQC